MYHFRSLEILPADDDVFTVLITYVSKSHTVYTAEIYSPYQFVEVLSLFSDSEASRIKAEPIFIQTMSIGFEAGEMYQLYHKFNSPESYGDDVYEDQYQARADIDPSWEDDDDDEELVSAPFTPVLELSPTSMGYEDDVDRQNNLTTNMNKSAAFVACLSCSTLNYTTLDHCTNCKTFLVKNLCTLCNKYVCGIKVCENCKIQVCDHSTICLLCNSLFFEN